MKYRKKPFIVEAFRLGIDNIPDWFMNKVTRNEAMLHGTSSGFEHHDDTTASIRVFDGRGIVWRHVDYGNYIIKTINGEVYPYEPELFKKIYEPYSDDQYRETVSVMDVTGKTPISFALQETMKRFENSEFEDDKIIYELFKRSKELWEAIKINGIEVYGLTFDEFCVLCKEKNNIVFLTDEEKANYNKAFEIMKILSKND